MATIDVGATKKIDLRWKILTLMLKASVESRTGGIRRKRIEKPHIPPVPLGFPPVRQNRQEWKQTISITRRQRNVKWRMRNPQSVSWMREYQAEGVKKERLSHQSEVTCFSERSLHRKLNYSQLWSPPNNNPGSAFHFTFMKKGRNWRCGLGGPMAAYLEWLKHVICDLHVRGERRWGEYGVQKWQTDGEKVKSTQKKNKGKRKSSCYPAEMLHV